MMSSCHRACAAGGLSPSTFDQPQPADTSSLEISDGLPICTVIRRCKKNLPARGELTVAAMSYSGHARPGYAIDLIRPACWRHDGPPVRWPCPVLPHHASQFPAAMKPQTGHFAVGMARGLPLGACPALRRWTLLRSRAAAARSRPFVSLPAMRRGSPSDRRLPAELCQPSAQEYSDSWWKASLFGERRVIRARR